MFSDQHKVLTRVNLAGKRTAVGNDEVHDGGSGLEVAGARKFVTFYFTNFPKRANYWFLRKGFEVCGILDDIYVAPRCNATGQAYGFVRFLKVRDVDKLVQALNNVWFGDFRIWVKVARFNKQEKKAVVKSASVALKGSGAVLKE